MVGIVVTLFVSWALSKTALRGVPTHYKLSFRLTASQNLLDTIVRATLDKSLYVLKRAIIVAAPAASGNVGTGQHLYR